MRVDCDELRNLLRLLGITRADEIDCEEFLALLPGYLERRRGGAEPVDEDARFLHHLGLCPFCREEADALLAALESGVL